MLVGVVGPGDPLRYWISEVRRIELLLFIASTRVSTIPGVSFAGVSPEATFYTPTLDVEYLVLGKPKSAEVIPLTPDGVPTPALITRAVRELVGLKVLVVDAGSYVRPKIPVVSLPEGVVGGRIDVENALPEGVASSLFESSRVLGWMVSSNDSLLVVGESMPGGTTTAMSIMEVLGFKALGRVSSSSPKNPHNIKERVFHSAVERVGEPIPLDDVFRAVELFGDPLHVSIAGFTAGAVEKGSSVLLAGGTQMCAVLAILKKLGVDLKGRVAIGTTRWIVEDPSSDIVGLVSEIAPEVPILYSKLSFDDAPYQGLRAYEEGYVKEGVGAGGCLVIASLLYRLGLNELREAIYREYARVAKLG